MLKPPKIKINWNNVADTALAIGLVGVVGIGGFYIAQHLFSFFSYQGLSRDEVIQTRNKVEKRLPILSRACGTDLFGDNFCRGIYLPENGNLLYYSFKDNGRDKASYQLYAVPSELWTTEKSLIPQRLIGKLVNTG